MTQQERVKVVSAISSRIRENGLLKLNQLSRVFDEEGIDRALYAETGPKRWLIDNFDEFYIEGSNGKETILLRDNSLASDSLSKMQAILAEEINRNGKILMSTIPKLLEPEGIQYRELSMGRKLTEWLPSVFPQFVVSEDNLWLSKRYVAEPEISPVSKPSVAEIQQMHSFAFMNWWNVNAKRLKVYNEELAAESKVKTAVAHQLARALLGVPGILIDASGDDEPRLAFNTGLQSKMGDAIYCVLMPNPKNESGKKQKWALEDFACVGDDTTLGSWLRDYCAPRLEKRVSFSTLEGRAVGTEEERKELIPLLTQYLDALSQGVIPSMKLAGRLSAFETALDELAHIYEQVWLEPYPARLTIRQVIEKTDDKNAVVQQLKNAVEAFDNMADKVHELFTSSKLPINDESTPQKDKARIHRHYDNWSGENDFDLFYQTLKAYRSLMNVMSGKDLSPEIEAQIEEVLCAHFTEISYKFAVRFLLDSEPHEWEFLKEIEKISNIIKKCQLAAFKSDDGRGDHSAAQLATAEELLDNLVQSQGEELLFLAQCVRSVYPTDEVEKMLISAETDELKDYLHEHRGELPYAVDAERIIADPDFPMELTYHGAATRLYKVVGNRSQTAEKYYLLGLALDERPCAQALLTLYREEQREEAFRKIFLRFFSERNACVEDQIYYLSILCREAPGEAMDYCRSNYYLFYQEESLKLLLAMPTDSLTLKMRELLKKRIEIATEYIEYNPLERAIISGDISKIRHMADAPYELGEMGYSKEEIDRVVQAVRVEDETDLASQDDYEIGLRLYRFQKNCHGLAEKYLWKGIATDEQIRGTQLLLLLAQEERWVECCELFECFYETYSQDINCRHVYLSSLLHCNAAKAQEYIRENLQDCLQMINSSAGERDIIWQLIESEDIEQSTFFEQVMQLNGFLADPFIRSVILMDRTLREYAITVNAEDLGLPEEFAGNISSLYKSDNYSHGMDAISISERTFRFFGTYKGVSEAFAEFALPDARAVTQLWKIYSSLEDEPQLFELLQSYPQMQTEHRDLYLKVLFQKEEYLEFIVNCDTADISIGRRLQLFIATLKTDPKKAGALPDIAAEEYREELSAWMQAWGSLLISTLIENDRIEDAETIVFMFFKGWITAYSSETIQSIITGENTVSGSMLLKMQEDAQKEGHIEIALYLYNVLHIGQMDGVARQYLDEKLQQIQSLGMDGKLIALRQLQRLYGGTLDKLEAEIALLEIQKIKDTYGMSSKEAAQKIGTIIRDFPANPEAIEMLLPLLKDTSICYHYHIYTNLAQLPARAGNSEAILRYFNQVSQLPEAKETSTFISFVCRFYIAAFLEERFPGEMLSETLELCVAYVRRFKAADGILCLYFVEKSLQQEPYAKYLLRTLADQSIDTLGEELNEIVDSEIQNTWQSALPSFFDLFREFLGNSTLSEIERYIEFANIAFSADIGEAIQAQKTIADWGKRMLSENDSNAILRQLYADPEDSAVWRQCQKLPLQDNPEGYAKLMFLASKKNWDLWEKCVKYCEKYEEFDGLLLDALWNWASCGLPGAVSACRIYLETRLNDQPDYFEKWQDKQQVLFEIMKALCDREKSSDAEYHHSLLRALILIAVKTESPEAIDYLIEKYNSALLGNDSSLSVVIVVRLLLDKRFEEAHKLLSLLSQSIAEMNYREMVDDLSQKTVSELAEWTGKAENTIKLRLVLPDGNSPNLKQINAVTYSGIREGHPKETADAIHYVLTMFPNDYGIHNALFDLCCTKFDGYLPLLHQSLRGMVRQLNENARSYYGRSQIERANMLATLDAVLIATDQTSVVKEYDFKEKTGDYILRESGGSLAHREAAAASEVREKTLETLRNRSDEEILQLSEVYLNCITGNWKDFIETSWKKKANISYEINCKIKEVDDIGFAHSLLQVLLETEGKDQRELLVKWLKDSISKSNQPKIYQQRLKQIEFVEDFLVSGCFAELEAQKEFGSLHSILDNPFEDVSLSSNVMKEYIDKAIKKNSEHLFALTWMIGSLVCRENFQSELAKIADENLFDKGNDKLASSMYYAMHKINLKFGLIHKDFSYQKGSETEQWEKVNRYKKREYYEARYRVTALFSNDENMKKKVGDPEFHVWSCVNLVLTLIYSDRADEIYRLCTYLSEKNVQVAKALLLAFDSTVDGQKKLEQIDRFEDDMTKIYYCFVLKSIYRPNNKSWNGYLLSTDVVEKANDRYNKLYDGLFGTDTKQNPSSSGDESTMRGDGEEKKRRNLPHTVLVAKHKDLSEYPQKDPALWAAVDEPEDAGDESTTGEGLFFAEDIEPIYDKDDISALLDEREHIPNLAGSIEKKKELSKKIYQHCIGGNNSGLDAHNALLLFGSDYYYAEISKGDYSSANSVILALARFMKQNRGEGIGYDTVEMTIQNGALRELLRSFHTLSELLDSYVANKSTYQFMQSMLYDPLLAACVGQIYAVLDSLINYNSPVAQNNSEALREELSEGYRKLEEIEKNSWMVLKNRVQKLINDEINELDQRPVLQIEVFNHGIQRNYGYLHGQVRNIGQVGAENIVLQANYDNNSHSRQYVLKRLSPGAKAVFEIDYSSAPGTEAIEYYLNVSFSYGEKIRSFLMSRKGTLEFGEIEEPQYPTNILCKDPNGIIFTVDEETGEVYSPEFIGRKKETAELRALVEGTDFASYRSALIYGIRRTGKTSLLNYLETYIKAHCPNVVCVKTDCQDMPAVDCIQYVFIDHVMDVVERQLSDIKDIDSWDQLKETWYSPNFCADQHPEKLSLFYQDVRNVMGEKGLYLIIDEIDRLFERIEGGQAKNQRNLDSLFGAMSAMLNSVECKRAVHFLICGSNWLIRYNLKGDKMNQLFQRFGKQVIEVGKLPEPDAKSVLCKPYEKYPQLEISENAIDWIWNYTGGLVWHTKLLGEEAIRRAKEDYRNVVYSSDVQQCLPKVLNDQWCKQFYEGCESGAEYQLVDAMQSQAAKRDAYVHINRIAEMLHWEIIEVQKTMAILKALKVVAQHPIDHQLYRFEQDIYRRYFRTTPSEYDRIPEEPDVFQLSQQSEN